MNSCVQYRQPQSLFYPQSTAEPYSGIFALASVHFPQPSFDVSCALDDLERMGEEGSVLPVTLG